MSRFLALLIAAALTLASAFFYLDGLRFLLWPLALFAFLTAVGVWDLFQTKHSVLRNYPILAHLRFFFEGIRPEVRQYFFESDTDEVPYNREMRSLVYQRAKDIEDSLAFGTRRNVYEPEYSWVNHSIKPQHLAEAPGRIEVGGPDCKQPYSLSIFNISAMSFGALSGNAIRALNRAARMGDFAHDTGEGGISRYHRAEGGDLIWEIGTGYFGCRNKDGGFSAELFEQQATTDQVKMAEIKLSQGAKPGHGGILPAAKVSEEIAEARGVPVGETVVSPAQHSAFTTPLEMVEFIAQLRELCGGKPVGFKLCVGHRWEFMGICKAILETGIAPDFIVVDGKEGGSGAAPREFTNHIGTPLVEGLNFVHNTLVGTGLRKQIRVGASGKIVSAFHIVKTISLGADYCNAARPFMFSVGCIQSLRCHTNTCPTGVATQDKVRQRALVVADKAKRAYNYHQNTVRAVREVLGAAGLTSTEELRHLHFFRRDGDGVAYDVEERDDWLREGELIEGSRDPSYARYWKMAQSSSFEADPHAG